MSGICIVCVTPMEFDPSTGDRFDAGWCDLIAISPATQPCSPKGRDKLAGKTEKEPGK